MFANGLIILMGFAFIMVKMPRRTALWLLGRPITLDIAASVLAYMLHWGTFSGVMAAAVAGMLCSVATAGARWCFGYIDNTGFHPGKFTVRIK